MKTVLSILFAAGSVLASRGDGASEPMRVMSYNIRYNSSSDTGAKSWDSRKSDLCKFVKRLDPDVMGLQEVTPTQRSYLEGKLSDWEFYGEHREGKDRDGKNKGEASPIAYRRSRFTFVKGGTFWLSDTPDKVGSKDSDAQFPRVCTWAKLRDNRDGRDFCFANTHLDHKNESARTRGLQLIAKTLKMSDPECPIIFTGDHNAKPGSAPEKVMSDLPMKDAYLVSDTPVKGPKYTSVGFECDSTSDKKRIDYVYVSKSVDVKGLETVDEPRGETGCYYSDHLPILATVLLHASGTVWFIDEIEKGTNFNSCAVTFSAYVTDFCAEDRATATLTLRDGQGRIETCSYPLLKSDSPTGEWRETFENVSRGDYYALTARLQIGDFETECERVFRAAREQDLFYEPQRLFCSQTPEFLSLEELDHHISDLVFHGVPCPAGSLDELPEVAARGGIAFLGRGDEVECVVKTAAGWTRTGATVPRETECYVMASCDRATGLVHYRFRVADEGWRDLGAFCVPSDSAEAQIEVSGCARASDILNRASDSHLIADATGAEFETLAEALQAGGREPLIPLWKTCAALATDRIGSLAVVDPNEWLSFGSGPVLLRRDSEGTTTRLYYGCVDPDEAATNHYLRAAADLGLKRLLSSQSDIRFTEWALPDASGEFDFRVRIDGEEVAPERIRKYLRAIEISPACLFRICIPSDAEF